MSRRAMGCGDPSLTATHPGHDFGGLVSPSQAPTSPYSAPSWSQIFGEWDAHELCQSSTRLRTNIRRSQTGIELLLLLCRKT